MTTSTPVPSLDGTELAGATTVVVGATGNVGFFVVDAFLRAGARVLAPTRSEHKFVRLQSRLPEQLRDNVSALYGDIGAPGGAADLAQQVSALGTPLAAVAASPASWHQTSSMFQAGFDDFRNTIETRLFPHYLAAESFLPLLDEEGGYVTINGPVAFAGPPYPGTGSIAVASAAQNKLMQAFAMETGGRPRVNDVVMWAYLGPTGTSPGSQLLGEQVGDYLAALVSKKGAHVHGQTLHLRERGQVAAAMGGDFGVTAEARNSS